MNNPENGSFISRARIVVPVVYTVSDKTILKLGLSRALVNLVSLIFQSQSAGADAFRGSLPWLHSAAVPAQIRWPSGSAGAG